MSVSPYEIMYGKPYESPEPNPNMHVTGKQDVYNYVLTVMKILALGMSEVFSKGGNVSVGENRMDVLLMSLR